MDAGRQERGMMIAATTKLTRKGEAWQVPSQAGNGTKYVVHPEKGYCSCPDHDATGAGLQTLNRG